MMFHNSLAVCVLALFVVTLQVSAQQANPPPANAQPGSLQGQPGNNKQVNVDQNVNVERQPQVIVIRILAKVFTKMAKKCLEAAAKECKDHWRKPKEALKCGGEYFKRNKGRCAIGKN